MRKNLFLFSLFALTLLITTGCYIQMSDGKNETMVGSRVFKGEYVEKTEFGDYSAYVTVYVNQDTIVEVVLNEDSRPITDLGDWMERPSTYDYDLAKYLISFEGKTIDEIKNYDPSKADEDHKLDSITGTTITSDRILSAVKDALSKI